MADPRGSLTVAVPSKGGTREVVYSKAQIDRMRLAREVWDQSRSIDAVAQALGVSHERARQIIDRGSALGLYPERKRQRGQNASTVHPDLSETTLGFASLLNREIARVAERATRPVVDALRRDLTRQRRAVAALRAEVYELSRDQRTLMKDFRRRLAGAPEVEGRELAHAHLGPKFIAAQRRRLGLSKAAFARLLRVSWLTVAAWESGARKPRAKARAALVAARRLGRREAKARLALLTRRPPPHA